MVSADFSYVYDVTFTNGTFEVSGLDLINPGDSVIIADNVPNGSNDDPGVLGDVVLDAATAYLASNPVIHQQINYLGQASYSANGSSGIVALAADGHVYYYTNNPITDLSGGPLNVQEFEPYTICFYPGTLIRCPDRELPVEALRCGDLVTTTDGHTMPVRWVGRQTVSTVFADPMRVLPIRIMAGALDRNVPARDLLLSPDHAVMVGGVLIQAGALVNGASILRETNVPQTFTYYHVELEDHSLIFAENTPAETFIDNVDRLAFDNWEEYEFLYPDGKAIVEMPYPRAKGHRQVPHVIREQLAKRAAALKVGFESHDGLAIRRKSSMTEAA